MNITDKEIQQLREKFYREALEPPDASSTDSRAEVAETLATYERIERAASSTEAMFAALYQFTTRRLAGLLPPKPPSKQERVAAVLRAWDIRDTDGANITSTIAAEIDAIYTEGK